MQKDLENAPRFAGVTNFRTLGGLPAAGGRRLRPHALLRADRLIGLDARDWEELARTGLATVCDLRSDAERAELIALFHRIYKLPEPPLSGH